MPTDRYTLYTKDSQGFVIYTDKLDKTWSHSKRDAKGNLILQSNPLKDDHRWISSVQYKTVDSSHFIRSVNDAVLYDPSIGSLMRRLEAESYAKFRGKLYSGSAALGVTLGSLKQSRQMIQKRYAQLSNKATTVIAEQVSAKQYGKRLASTHLEVIFGWQPLIADIQALTLTVIQDADDRQTVGSSSTGTDFRQFEHLLSSSNTKADVVEYIRCRVSRNAMVRVSNPNAWLAERAGTLNMAAVAWDLVPWSFLINMFVSTGQLVNSITDFYGLAFENDSMTKLSVGRKEYTLQDSSNYGDPKSGKYYRIKGRNTGSYTAEARIKTRTLGNADARPPMVLKMPNVDWNLAAMAASLFTQQLGRIAKPIQKIYPGLTLKEILKNAQSSRPRR